MFGLLLDIVSLVDCFTGVYSLDMAVRRVDRTRILLGIDQCVTIILRN